MITIRDTIKFSKELKVGQRVILIDHLENNARYEPVIGSIGKVEVIDKNAEDNSISIRRAQDVLVRWDDFEIYNDHSWYTSSACLEVVDEEN